MPLAATRGAPKCVLLSVLLYAAPFSLAAAGTMRQDGPPMLRSGVDSSPVQGRSSVPARRGGAAFATGWVGNLSSRGRIWPLLRGGGGAGAASQQCSWCTKVHQVSAQCKAQRISDSRAASGRRTTDGWQLLTTMREEKVGKPKGLSEYGWGSTGYVQSTEQRAPVQGCEGVFTVLGIETSCDDTAAAVVRRHVPLLSPTSSLPHHDALASRRVRA